jgi:hypothetical protein
MCLRDGCACEITISDINKSWIESNPPTELEQNQTPNEGK